MTTSSSYSHRSSMGTRSGATSAAGSEGDRTARATGLPPAMCCPALCPTYLCRERKQTEVPSRAPLTEAEFAALPQWSTDLHLIHMVEGEGRLQFGGRQLVAGSGSVLAVPVFEPCGRQKRTGARWTMINLHILIFDAARRPLHEQTLLPECVPRFVCGPDRKRSARDLPRSPQCLVAGWRLPGAIWAIQARPLGR